MSVVTFSDGSVVNYPRHEKNVSLTRENWSPAQAALGTATGCHAAYTSTASAGVLTTGITNPTCPRNVTATAGGTAGDIKAISVTVTGTDINDETIFEVLPAFTENTAGIVVGSKAFKTVTQIDIPAHDGTGATTAVGYGAKLGLSNYLRHNTCLFTSLNGVVEGTAATLATSLTSLSNNTIALNSALNGTAVQTIYVKHFDQTYVG